MILTISRRTDIPAFYSKWFMNRIKEREKKILGVSLKGSNHSLCSRQLNFKVKKE